MNSIMCTLFFLAFFFFHSALQKKKSHFHVISKYPFKRPLILHGAIERHNRNQALDFLGRFEFYPWLNFVGRTLSAVSLPVSLRSGPQEVESQTPKWCMALNAPDFRSLVLRKNLCCWPRYKLMGQDSCISPPWRRGHQLGCMCTPLLN